MADNNEDYILNIVVKYDDAINKIAEFKEKQDDLKQSNKELQKQFKNNEITSEQYYKAVEKNNTAVKQYSESIRALEKEMRNNIQIEKEKEGSLKQLSRQLSEMTAKYKEMSEQERNSSKGQELAEKILATNNALKAAEEELGDFRRQVGSYEKAIRNSIISNNKYAASFSALASGSGGVIGGIKAMTAAAWQFVKTPLGAAIAAIVGVIELFKAGIQSSEENTAKFNQVLAPLKVLFDMLLNSIQSVVGVLLDWVNLIVKGYSVVGEFVAKLFGMERAYSNVNAKVQEGIQLEKDKLQLSKDTRKNNEETKQTELEVAELRSKVAQKDKYTHKERIAFLDEAIKKETEVSESKKKLAERNLAIMEAEAARAQNTEEVENKLSEARQKVTQATIDLNNKTRELNAQRVEAINAIKAETQAEKNKAKEIKSKETEAIRQAEDAALSILKDGIEKQRLLIETNYDRQISDLKKRLDTENTLTKTAREAINSNIKSLEQAKQQELNKISDEEVKKRIETEAKKIQLELDAVGDNAQQAYTLRLAKLDKEKELELSNKDLTERDKQLIEQKYRNEAKSEEEKYLSERYNEEANMLKLKYENAILQARDGSVEEYRIRLDQAKAEYDAVLNMDQATKEALFESDEEYTNYVLQHRAAMEEAEDDLKNAEQESVELKLQAAKAIGKGFEDAANAFAEDSVGLAKLAKAIALFNIALDTASAISKGISSAQSVPFPGNLVAIVTTISTILANIAAAKNIISQAKEPKAEKFATGGIISGAGSGTSDNIPIWASNGESIMTSRATSMFAPLLSELNQAGGGVPIEAVEASAQTIGEDMLAKSFAKALSQMPNPVVSVEEINRVSNRVNVLEKMSKL